MPEKHDTGKCKDCMNWFTEGEDVYSYTIIRPEHPATRTPMTDDEILQAFGFFVNYCNSPKVAFFARPEIDGASVVDSSRYYAKLITGPDFGCINFRLAEPEEEGGEH